MDILCEVFGLFRNWMLRDGKFLLIKMIFKCFVYRKNILVLVCILLKKVVEVDILLKYIYL